jgi:hypothetical protein
MDAFSGAQAAEEGEETFCKKPRKEPLTGGSSVDIVSGPLENGGYRDETGQSELSKMGSKKSLTGELEPDSIDIRCLEATKSGAGQTGLKKAQKSP